MFPENLDRRLRDSLPKTLREFTAGQLGAPKMALRSGGQFSPVILVERLQPPPGERFKSLPKLARSVAK
jgi:hypothetical protein